ncbi:N-acetylmuramic acid 6-phosphate etherase [Kiloniella antarctica]|uniref:N-acetylmuramic acid 6-phosphate etherase n=1 Tax=Kiloniella antarctica TaxID=1550907 RepID=A0ABW5BQH7_9PROT
MAKNLQQTERHSPRYRGLETWPDEDILESLWASQLKAVSCVQLAIPSIEKGANEVAERLSNGGRLFYIGAGSSGHLAIQDGLELNPTYGWPLDRLIPLIAGGEKALLSPMGGAEDDTHSSVETLKYYDISDQDVLIAVAASGSTPYTLAAVKHANKIGALVVTIANNEKASMFEYSNHRILLNSGSEVIAGSTRMAAGTAQKTALNMLSTLVMTKLGHVHDGLMVSMIINNEKLANRGVEIVQEITGDDWETSKKALEDAQNDIKLAVLLAMQHPIPDATNALKKSNGHLGQAIQLLNL